MNVTIKHIARKANVSYSTVSRALNNKYGVWPQTRQKILKIAEQLNYSPNAIARGLVKKRTNTLGLLIPDITNPFFPEVARGIEDEAKQWGYSVFLCNSNWEREREIQYLRLLAERRVDGMIIAAAGDEVDEVVEKHPLKAVPVIYVSNVPQNTKRSYVAIDNLRGGFLATKHLIEAGYTKIGFIGAVEQFQPVDQRLLGFRLAMEQYHLPIEERYIRLGHYGHEQTTSSKLIKEMISSGDFPRAVFAENDLLALGVIDGVQSTGLTVPEDVAVVGFDDIPFASYQELGLTTVSQPKYEMGKMAVRMLLEEIEAETGVDTKVENGTGTKRKEGASRRVVLEPELIVRKTTVISS
jgi:LacI family transcriptional regulator